MNRLLIAVLLLFASVSIADAVTYYQSPSGSDAYTSEQAQNSGTPWKTFSKSFGSMSAGDELVLLDGTYSVATGTGAIAYDGTGSAQAPSGTSKVAMTTVRAQNNWAAVIDGAGTSEGTAIFVGRSSTRHEYIKFQGLRTNTGMHIYNGRYIYFKDCALRGGATLGTSDAVTGGTQYSLVEDCWVWDDAKRVLFNNYQADYTVARRVVIRKDGCDATPGKPCVGINSYNSIDTAYMNIIAVDNLIQGTGSTEPYSDFATAQHSGTLTGTEWYGIISLNSAHDNLKFEGIDATGPTQTVRNAALIDPGSNRTNVTFREGTDSVLDYFTVGRTSGTGNYLVYRDDTTPTTTHGIITGDCNQYALVGCGTASYINTYGTHTAGTLSSCSVPTGYITTNPATNGLLYPVRIETGSNLDPNYGATIIKRYGTDGYFRDDAGYATLGAVDLWPYPNEDSIKSHLSETYGGGGFTAARGFCTGTSIGGESQSLTRYIWEYLGNQIPAGIYTDTTPPTVPAAAANGSTVSITTDETTVWAGYDASDCNLDCSVTGTDIGLTSPSGSGTAWTLTAASAIQYGETCNLDCTLSTDDIEDTSGNDMVTFADTNVTNNTPQASTPTVLGGMVPNGLRINQ